MSTSIANGEENLNYETSWKTDCNIETSYLSSEWVNNMNACTDSLHQHERGDVGEISRQFLRKDH